MNEQELIEYLERFKKDIPVCVCIMNPSEGEYDESELITTDEGDKMIFVEIEHLYFNSGQKYMDESGDIKNGEFITLIF